MKTIIPLFAGDFPGTPRGSLNPESYSHQDWYKDLLPKKFFFAMKFYYKALSLCSECQQTSVSCHFNLPHSPLLTPFPLPLGRE